LEELRRLKQVDYNVVCKFKIGDKVRIVKSLDVGYYSDGALGVITELPSQDGLNYSVEFYAGNYCINAVGNKEWYVSEYEIALSLEHLFEEDL